MDLFQTFVIEGLRFRPLFWKVFWETNYVIAGFSAMVWLIGDPMDKFEEQFCKGGRIMKRMSGWAI